MKERGRLTAWGKRLATGWLRCAGGGRKEGRRLKDLVGEDAGVLALADGDRWRLTERW